MRASIANPSLSRPRASVRRLAVMIVDGDESFFVLVVSFVASVTK